MDISNGSSAPMTRSYQTVGSFDDILDVAIVQQDSGANFDDIKLAVVSNSAVLYIWNSSGNSEPLLGHTDIILAVEVFPGGYVFNLLT